MSRKGTFRHEGSTTAAWLLYPPGQPGASFWIPRSVCTHRSKLNNDLHPLTEVTVEGWWLEKNPELGKYFS